MNPSPISQAPCNRVLGLFPPLAGICRFATQTRVREEALALIHHCKSIECGVFIQDELIVAFYVFSLPGAPFSTKMLSLRISHRYIICECLCCLIFIFAEVSKSD